MSDGPRHYSSSEMTAVRPSPSTVPGPTIEQLDVIERHRRAIQESTETLVACPACAGCNCCHGEHMVSAERACEYRRVTALTACVPVDDEPPPEAA